jgi:hypothetical protein
MEAYREKEDEQIEKINNLAQSTENPNDPQLKKMIDEYLNTRTEMDEERKAFINSLPDILTYKQIATLVAFEPRFRDEIRKILLEERKHKPSREP